MWFVIPVGVDSDDEVDYFDYYGEDRAGKRLSYKNGTRLSPSSHFYAPNNIQPKTNRTNM